MAGVRKFQEEAVLEKAEALFRRKGYEATSMLDLAEATGVQRGSLYNAYGDKEGLFLRTFGRYEARFLAAAARALETPDIRAALTTFFEEAIENMAGNAAVRGCFTTRMAAEGELPGPRVREKVRGLLVGLDGLLNAALSRAEAQGRTVLPPSEASRMVVTFTRGLAVMERVHGDPAALRETAHAFIDLLLPQRPSA